MRGTCLEIVVTKSDEKLLMFYVIRGYSLVLEKHVKPDRVAALRDVGRVTLRRGVPNQGVQRVLPAPDQTEVPSVDITVDRKER